MNINRHNYESFFLLYADNELQPAEKKAVEAFVLQNPDLEKELALLQQSVFRPETGVVFAGKEDLMRSENPLTGIHTGNYESFFLLHADNELTADEKKTVEAFLDLHPQYQGELELLHAARMSADPAVVYEGKQDLYRREEKDKVVPFAWWRLAAAAIVLVLLGIWWLTRPVTTPPAPLAGGGQHKPATPPVQAPVTPQTALNPAPVNNPTAAAGKDIKEQAQRSKLAVSPRRQEKDQLALHPVKSKPLPKAQEPKDQKQDLASNNLPEPTERPSTLSQRTRNDNAIAVTSMRTPVKETLIDKLRNISRQEEPNPDVQFASYDNSNNDQIDVLNTSVNKTALRGILRKASRIIAKKTSTGDEDDANDNRKHILIGSFAIAVK